MTKTAPHGPLTCEYTFHFTNGEYDAEVKFDAPFGHIAAHSDVADMAANALKAMEDQAQGFRFMTREEFVQKQLSEQTGVPGRFAVPSGEFSEEWAK